MGFTSDACWFLLIKNNKKREAALKNEAGGDEKHVFFLLGLKLFLDMVAISSSGNITTNMPIKPLRLCTESCHEIGSFYSLMGFLKP